ncbi:hypothetical protein TPSD3_07435 [Thioflexithrix psekupsensis]|uniref:Uncharacterized protein n=2 Tax=Thioflexithrix psekupsensis TaxID=1570016 RepID=A0A251X8V6_9GAMM|nr:hypothetical protein TPSD3_07435 [Thioflexithrix psekupsensis]
MSFRITTYALNKNDDVLFRSMLQIVNAQLTALWDFTEKRELAHLTVVDLENPMGWAFWQQQHAHIPLIAYTKENTQQATWFLEKPIRVKPLIQLLNTFSTTHCLPVSLPESAEVVIPPTPPVDPASTRPKTTATAAPLLTAGHFDGQHTLIARLHQAKTQAHAQRFYLPNAAELLYSPTQRCALTQESLNNYLQQKQTHLYNAPLALIRQEPITEAAFNERRSRFFAYAPEAIEWVTVLCSSQGRLNKNLSRMQTLRLKQWPNFAMLPHQAHHIRLAAFMNRNTATAEMIAEKTTVSIDQVIDFINACHQLHLVETPKKTQLLAKKPLSEQQRDLFRGILKRLLQ